MVLLWRSGENLQDLVLFFHHLKYGAQIQVVSLDGKFLYPVSPLTGSPCLFVNATMASLSL